jgi:hypothetical protein
VEAVATVAQEPVSGAGVLDEFVVDARRGDRLTWSAHQVSVGTRCSIASSNKVAPGLTRRTVQAAPVVAFVTSGPRINV